MSRPSAHTRVRDEEALDAGEVAHAVRATDEHEAEYRASGTVALSAVRPRTAPDATAEAVPERTVSLPKDRAARKRRRLSRPA